MDKYEFTRHVRLASGLNVYEKSLLYTVAEHYNWTNQAASYASQTTLAIGAGMERKSANTYIKSLQEKGWLKRDGRVGSSDFLVPLVPTYVPAVFPKRGAEGVPAKDTTYPSQGHHQSPAGTPPVPAGDTNNEENKENKSEPNQEEEILVQEDDAHPSLEFSTSDLPLASPTTAAAPSIDELVEDDSKVQWLDEQLPGASESNQASQDAQEPAEKRTWASGAVPDLSKIEEAVAVNAEQRGWSEDKAEAVLAIAIDLRVEGSRDDVWALARAAESKFNTKDDATW